MILAYDLDSYWEGRPFLKPHLLVSLYLDRPPALFANTVEYPRP
jgi:hypothetical protein